jgi:hypothetical protein
MECERREYEQEVNSTWRRAEQGCQGHSCGGLHSKMYVLANKGDVCAGGNWKKMRVAFTETVPLKSPIFFTTILHILDVIICDVVQYTIGSYPAAVNSIVGGKVDVESRITCSSHSSRS